MAMLLQLVRGRLRIPILWVLIASVLGAGVITWVVRRDNGAGNTRTASGPNGLLVPVGPSDSSTLPVIAGAPGTVVAAGPTSSTAHAGPVRVAAGPGTVTVS